MRDGDDDGVVCETGSRRSSPGKLAGIAARVRSNSAGWPAICSR